MQVGQETVTFGVFSSCVGFFFPAGIAVRNAVLTVVFGCSNSLQELCRIVYFPFVICSLKVLIFLIFSIYFTQNVKFFSLFTLKLEPLALIHQTHYLAGHGNCMRMNASLGCMAPNWIPSLSCHSNSPDRLLLI